MHSGMRSGGEWWNKQDKEVEIHLPQSSACCHGQVTCREGHGTEVLGQLTLPALGGCLYCKEKARRK